MLSVTNCRLYYEYALFFSSRRRHTRFDCAWSSDVCSSDLGFQDGIREKIISANPHILIVEGGGRGLVDGEAVAARARAVTGVRAASPFVLQQALYTAQGGGATGGLLRGLDLGAASVRGALAAQLRLRSMEHLPAAGRAA